MNKVFLGELSQRGHVLSSGLAARIFMICIFFFFLVQIGRVTWNFRRTKEYPCHIFRHAYGRDPCWQPMLLSKLLKTSRLAIQSSTLSRGLYIEVLFRKYHSFQGTVRSSDIGFSLIETTQLW